MKIKGKRILRNGTVAGYVLQKDKTWRWQFLKKSQSGGASSDHDAADAALRTRLGLPDKNYDLRKTRILKNGRSVEEYLGCTNDLCRSDKEYTYEDGIKAKPCIVNDQIYAYMKIGEPFYNYNSVPSDKTKYEYKDPDTGKIYYYNRCLDKIEDDKPFILKTDDEKKDKKKQNSVHMRDQIIKYNEGELTNITGSEDFAINPYTFNNNKSKLWFRSLKIKEYGAGGDCLFKSIAGCIQRKFKKRNLFPYKGTSERIANEYHMLVRSKIVNKLQELLVDEELRNKIFGSNGSPIKPGESIYDNQMQLRTPVDYIKYISQEGNWGTDLEIQLATLVNWGSEANPFYIDIYIFDVNGFNQAFINKESKNFITIYNNGRTGARMHTGGHYQGYVSQKPIYGKFCPIINWGILSDDSTPDSPHPAAHSDHPATAAPGVEVAYLGNDVPFQLPPNKGYVNNTIKYQIDFLLEHSNKPLELAVTNLYESIKKLNTLKHISNIKNQQIKIKKLIEILFDILENERIGLDVKISYLKFKKKKNNTNKATLNSLNELKDKIIQKIEVLEALKLTLSNSKNRAIRNANAAAANAAAVNAATKKRAANATAAKKRAANAAAAKKRAANAKAAANAAAANAATKKRAANVSAQAQAEANAAAQAEARRPENKQRQISKNTELAKKMTRTFEIRNRLNALRYELGQSKVQIKKNGIIKQIENLQSELREELRTKR